MNDASRKPFLTAEWRRLVMANFEIDGDALAPFVPSGVELDVWRGRNYVSLVGFLFLKTRVLGAAVPWHENFEEVNLRFYVRRKVGAEWRRGVVFVKEIVPRRLIAWTARALYGEPYVAAPMSHEMRDDASRGEAIYSWRIGGRTHRLAAKGLGPPAESAIGSEAEFITEHYYGYSRRRGGGTTEYRVDHPRWRVRSVATCDVECDVEALYGARFVEALKARPTSAFMAEGSEVEVFRGTKLEVG